ncbi:MAG: FecR family protein [Bryobacteraceae bacterium]
MRLSLAATLVSVAAAFVCFAQTPPAGSLASGAAEVISLTGQVSVLRDSQPWALGIGDTVDLQQVIATGPDGYAVFQVSDGSTFEVFPNSEVVFRKTPGNWKDLLDILIGRVKFTIQKYGGQPNYNRVITPTAVISVRGTVFDVEVEDSDATTLVVVDEGQVEVQHARHPGKARLLNAGEWLRVYRDQPLAKSVMDKGSLFKGTVRAIADALYTAVYRNRLPSTGGGTGGTIPGAGTGTGGSTPLPGDTGETPAPPAPGN